MIQKFVCTTFERCGGEAGYCAACVSALLEDEKNRCAKIAEARPLETGVAIAKAIRESETEE